MTSPTATAGLPEAELRPDLPAIEGFRSVLADLADVIARNRQGTIERLDPEFLHDLRVAARRSRAVLAAGGRVIPDDVRREARLGFALLSDLTGPPRDLDVYLLGWAAYTEPLGPHAAVDLEPVRAHLIRAQDEAYATLTTWLQSEEALDRLASWRRWLTGPLPEVLPDRALDPLGPYVAKRIRRAQATLLDEGRAITAESPDERLHDLRKDAKKLRYLLECFGALLDPGPRAKLVKRLKALQENLGEHQDAAVHAAELRTVAHHLAAAWPATTGASTDTGPEDTGLVDTGLVDTGLVDTLLVDTLLATGRLLGELEGVRDRTRLEFAARFECYDRDATSHALDAALRGARL